MAAADMRGQAMAGWASQSEAEGCGQQNILVLVVATINEDREGRLHHERHDDQANLTATHTNLQPSSCYCHRVEIHTNMLKGAGLPTAEDWFCLVGWGLDLDGVLTAVDYIAVEEIRVVSTRHSIPRKDHVPKEQKK